MNRRILPDHRRQGVPGGLDRLLGPGGIGARVFVVAEHRINVEIQLSKRLTAEQRRVGNAPVGVESVEGTGNIVAELDPEVDVIPSIE